MSHHPGAASHHRHEFKRWRISQFRAEARQGEMSPADVVCCIGYCLRDIGVARWREIQRIMERDDFASRFYSSFPVDGSEVTDESTERFFQLLGEMHPRRCRDEAVSAGAAESPGRLLPALAMGERRCHAA